MKLFGIIHILTSAITTLFLIAEVLPRTIHNAPEAVVKYEINYNLHFLPIKVFHLGELPVGHSQKDKVIHSVK